MKTDLLNIVTTRVGKLQTRALLSLQKSIDKAAIPVTLYNIKKDYVDKLEYVEQEQRKFSSSQIKALTFEDTYIVDVICYTTNNPNQLDEATGKAHNKIKPASTNEVGNRYWMVSIGDGIRQYTINTPKYFNSLELVKRTILDTKLN